MDSLCTITFTSDERVLKIQHSLKLTMVTSKISSALTRTSSARCYICEETYRGVGYDYSTIEIAFFECDLSFVYRFEDHFWCSP